MCPTSKPVRDIHKESKVVGWHHDQGKQSTAQIPAPTISTHPAQTTAQIPEPTISTHLQSLVAVCHVEAQTQSDTVHSREELISPFPAHPAPLLIGV
jgi:hypothetical protein